MMKKIILFVLTVIYNSLSIAQNNSLNTFYNNTDDFFSDYVVDGRVKYADLKEHPKPLNDLINLSNSITIDKSDVNNFQAFWINVYNLGVIKALVDEYPVSSPQEIPGFFVDNKYMLGGQLTTFNIIENEILRGNFDEPRFHFVLVCGAISCPPITNFAYRPNMLDLQMDKQTRDAVNDPSFLRIDKSKEKVEFSEIFKWYAEDFKKTGLSEIEYANKYRKEKIPSHYKSSYYSYNWQINGHDEGMLGSDASTQTISNIRAFTPSSLLKKGQWDFKLFNNLYTQTKLADENGNVVDTDNRTSFLTTTLEINHGISKNGRVNVGFIIGTRSAINNEGSIGDVFHYSNENLDAEGDGYAKRAGLTSIAPIIKVSPFRSVPNFSFQTSLSIPLFKEITYGYFDKRSYVWDTKFFFDKSFGRDQFQVFAELDFNYSFGEDAAEVRNDPTKNSGERFANESLGLPLSLFLSYFPSDKFTVYINGQQYVLVDLGNNYHQDYTQVGFGLKYQATTKLNVELSHGQFIRGSNWAGLGQTYNLGLRYIL